MIRGSRCALVCLALSCLACRATDSDCSDLARHVAELAQAEGKGGVGTALALEAGCKEQRPTRALVQCVLAAQTLAQVEAC